jgi:hypothetical protein
MRRIAMLTCALTALSGAASAHAADSPAARLVGCDVKAPGRSADFYGRMDTVPGATRLAIRFTVLERLGKEADWTKVDLPDLRDWHRSATGVKTFGYRQTLDNLRTGGAYKARILFRWTNSAGDVIASDTKETPVCRGPLPNLRVSGLVVRNGPTADTKTYRVTVQNDGKATADGIGVLLTVDSAVLDAARMKNLGAGESRTVSFTGPACNHGVRVSIDPDNVIGELLEADNSQLFACP